MSERDWFTAAELAALALPGLPRDKSPIIRRAKREDWPARPRQGRGGGREYPVSALPQEARDALVARRLAEAAPAESAPPAPTEPAPAAELAGWQRRAMEARATILQEVERQGRQVGISYAQAAFARAAQAGELADHLAQAVGAANNRGGKRGSRTVTTATLRRWRAARQDGGVEALAPAPAKPATGQPAWLPYFLQLYRRPTKPSVAACHEKLPGLLPAGVAMPSLRAVQRTIQRLDTVEANRGRMGPRELKTLRAHVVRDSSRLVPTDVYTADGHTADVEVQHPEHGRPIRPELTAVVDVATRRCVGWSVALSESSWAVADALRHACEAGVPAIFYTDNGCGYKNELLNGPATGILSRLGVTHEFSLPYGSQARGVIERFNASWIRAAKDLPAYVGRDMDKDARQIAYKRGRRDIAERGASKAVLSWTAFLQWASDQVAAYNTRPHSGLAKVRDEATGKLRHQSPDEAWAAAAGEAAEPVEAEVLADLFRPYEIRQVRRAQVKLFGNGYFAQALEPYHGEEVQVGYDIHDPSKVWVRDAAERLICEAGLDANKVDYFPQSRVEQARDKRAEARDTRLQQRREEVRAERGRGGEPAIEVAPKSAAEQAQHDKVVADLSGRHEGRNGEQGFQPPGDALERTILRLDLETAQAQGEAVDEAAWAWAERFAATPMGQRERRSQYEFAQARRETRRASRAS